MVVPPPFTQKPLPIVADLLEAVVQKDGHVGDVIVVRSIDQTFGLDQEAVNAAKEWQFVPGTRMGEPAAVVVTIELSFILR